MEIGEIIEQTIVREVNTTTELPKSSSTSAVQAAVLVALDPTDRSVLVSENLTDAGIFGQVDLAHAPACRPYVV